MNRALFIYGGWEAHQPQQIAELFADELQQRDFETVMESSLDILSQPDELKNFSLIFLCWTSGQLIIEQSQGLQEAVRAGVGLGGVHGGLGDAFRGCTAYEWMVGGHFVGHPYVGKYAVRLTNPEHPITREMPASFIYNSEQYYMLIDPMVDVLAETDYSYENRSCIMPVMWTKRWGHGRIFYNALGHKAEEFEKYPDVRLMTVRGLLWAARCIG
jgi:type 1 glutamine amidotransferase